MATHPDYRGKLLAEVARVRDARLFGRSDVLQRLFEALVERALAGKRAKEMEIAQDVFHQRDAAEVMQDASVRVGVHRIRRKLEEHYERQGGTGGRLIVPRGEYLLAYVEGGEAAAVPDDAAPPVEVEPAPPPLPRRKRWALAALLGVLVVALLAALVVGRVLRRDDGGLWQGVGQNGRPIVIVVGDYYIFGETGDGVDVDRLVRRFDVNSKEDLENYLALNPDQSGRASDVGLTYAPTGALPALGAVLAALHTGSGQRPDIIPMSRFSPDLLRTHDVVYVGYLSGLGILREPVLGASRLKVGSSYDELVDRVGGRRFTADWNAVSEGEVQRRDFAYLARLPGPNGNHIVIIAGLRDAALAQAGLLSSSADELAHVRTVAHGADAFEALFQVSAVGPMNLASALVLAGPPRTTDIWDRSTPVRLPDQR